MLMRQKAGRARLSMQIHLRDLEQAIHITTIIVSGLKLAIAILIYSNVGPSRFQ